MYKPKQITTYIYHLLVVFSLQWNHVGADYDCICNYMNEVKAGIYSTPDDQEGPPIDFLNPNDCKPTYGAIVNGFNGIAFEHQVAYVKVGNRVASVLCQGNIPDSDKVTTPHSTTSVPTTTRTETTRARAPTTITTTANPTTILTTTTPIPNTSRQTSTTTATTPMLTKPTTPVPTPTVTTTNATPITRPTTPMSTTVSTAVPTTSFTTSAATTTLPTPIVSTTTSTVYKSPTPDYVFPGNTQLCQSKHVQHASSHQNMLAQRGEYCYELMTHTTVTWEHAEKLCSSGHGHLVSITSTEDQAFVEDFLQRHLPTHAIWIGLHDTNIEGHFEWTNGDPVNYTNWKPGHVSNFVDHTREDCVAMIPYQDGVWDDIPCGMTGILGGDVGETHYMMCQFRVQPDMVTTSTSTIHTTQMENGLDGNTKLCSSSNVNHAVSNGNVMAQYGSHCYELMPHEKVTWNHAERLCKSSGGHLLHIGSVATQTFIESFLKRHMPSNAVWIGLNDLNREQHFEWTTGDPVQYTNWLPNHKDNFVGHDTEDCVALIPYKDGVWDDIPCGDTGLFGVIGESHYVICQYDTILGATFVG